MEKELPSTVTELKDEIAACEEKISFEEGYIARKQTLLEHEIRNRNELFHRPMTDRRKKRELLNRYADKIRSKQMDQYFAKEALKQQNLRLNALKTRLAKLEKLEEKSSL